MSTTDFYGDGQSHADRRWGWVGFGGEPMTIRRDETGTPLAKLDTIEPPDPALAAAREAREAIEAQRTDEADRAERETAAKRAHAIEVMRLTLDHNVAVRQVAGIDPCYVAWLMAAAAGVSALVTGLVAAVIP